MFLKGDRLLFRRVVSHPARILSSVGISIFLDTAAVLFLYAARRARGHTVREGGAGADLLNP